MIFARLAPAVAFALLCTACASTSTPKTSAPAATSAAAPAPAAAPKAGETRVVKSRDGKYEGEMVGTPQAGSKFAQLQIGMSMGEVQDLMGRAPDRSHSYESGKRWIPFYFGNDARRVQALYKGEGCLIMTGGNIWGGAGGDLIQVNFDTTGACYQP